MFPQKEDTKLTQKEVTFDQKVIYLDKKSQKVTKSSFFDLFFDPYMEITAKYPKKGLK